MNDPGLDDGVAGERADRPSAAAPPTVGPVPAVEVDDPERWAKRRALRGLTWLTLITATALFFASSPILLAGFGALYAAAAFELVREWRQPNRLLQPAPRHVAEAVLARHSEPGAVAYPDRSRVERVMLLRNDLDVLMSDTSRRAMIGDGIVSFAFIFWVVVLAAVALVAFGRGEIPVLVLAVGGIGALGGLRAMVERARQRQQLASDVVRAEIASLQGEPQQDDTFEIGGASRD